MLIVLITTPTASEAQDIAKKIVTAKLAACVQVLPPMTSYYYWEGEVQNDSEHLLLIKTLDDKYEALERFILENHSYEVPEIVAIKAERVSESYYGWLAAYLT